MAEIQVMKNILGENDRIAAENQAMFAAKGVYVVNLMGSPGAGKTSVLEKTMEKLKDELKMAVIEGDLFTSKDADRIERHGVPVIQINTADINDRRRFVITLTPAGKQIIDDQNEIVRKRFNDRIQHLSSTEKAKLGDSIANFNLLIEKMFAN